MDFKQFTSDDGWLNITIPSDWEEFDNGDDGTYTFSNANSGEWRGNFRITPMRFSKTTSTQESSAEKLISEEIEENKGAVKIMMNNLQCAHYKKNIV